MSSRFRGLILVFALVGLGFATASTWVHYKVVSDPTYTSPCDINAAFNCTQVYLSRFGSIGGVPVALGGIFWFALVALVAALHVYFLVLEMFLWDRPFGRRTFRLTAEFAAASKPLAANQGLYNGFLAAGLGLIVIETLIPERRRRPVRPQREVRSKAA